MTILGAVLFLVSYLMALPAQGLYLEALLLMFIAAVLVGIGAANIMKIDRVLDQPRGECYFCSGTGRLTGVHGTEVCPRCGGTGLARPEDSQ